MPANPSSTGFTSIHSKSPKKIAISSSTGKSVAQDSLTLSGPSRPSNSTCKRWNSALSWSSFDRASEDSRSNTEKLSRIGKDANFIPEHVPKDDSTDYWRIYQDRLNQREPVDDTARLRLCQWLIDKGLTKESVRKLTKLMGELRRRSVPINTDHYNDLIHFYIKCSKFQEAQSIIDSLDTKPRNLTVNQRMFALQLALYLKSGNESAIQDLVEKSKTGFMYFMEQFIRWTKGLQLKDDQINRVKAILFVLQTINCPPNSERFTALLGTLFARNQPEEALGLVNHTLDIGFTANNFTATCVISGLLKAGRFPEALQISGRIMQSKDAPDVAIFNSFLSRLSQDPNRFGSAKELWDHMLKDPMIQPDAVSFASMLNGYMRVHDPASALNLWEAMQKKPHTIKPNAVMYNTLILGLFRNRQPGLAKDFYEEMVTRPDIKVSLDTYHIMIKGLLSVKDHEALAKVLKRMEEGGIKPNEMTFSIITDTIFSRRDSQSALKVAELMTERGIPQTAITFSCKVAGFANVGDLDNAQRTFEEMQQAGYEPSIHSYGAMMQGALKVGNTEMAEQFAAFAKTRVEDGLTPTGYLIMISGYAELLMLDKAEKWLYEQQEAMSRDGRNSVSWKAYYTLLRICVKHRLWEPAQRVVESMKRTGFQSQVPKLDALIHKVEQNAHPSTSEK
ncbi:hypothetical protein BGX34_001145 [Mortierella sp. NVP85]|nr:hypothetical protein BGX34_001145 [Mortierella sp. NVP85]